MTRKAAPRVALITGAANGIGRATAERLLADGGRVVAVDLDADDLGWTEEVEHIVPFAGDVSDASVNERAVAMALDHFGGLDSLVLNAGMTGLGGIEELEMSTFDRVLDVNVRGLVLGLKAGIAALTQATAGSVVITASVSGLGGDPGMWAYNTAKGAAVNLVRAASLELAHRGIRVNGVCPGPTRTKMTGIIERMAPAEYDAMRNRIPLKRWGEASEIAEVIAFLASPAASFVTGALVPVDGGIGASTGQFLPPDGDAG